MKLAPLCLLAAAAHAQVSSLTLPPKWTMEPAARSGNRTAILIHDPQLPAFIWLECYPAPADYPADIQRSMMGAINSRTARQAEKLQHYQLLTNTIEWQAIGGLPAVAWQASYSEERQPMRDYCIRIRGRKAIAVFSTQIAAAQSASFRTRFYPIAQSLRLTGEPPADPRRPIPAAEIQWVPMIGQSWAERWGERPRSSLHIPVRFDGIPGSFMMQLDTGAPRCPLLGDPRQVDPSFTGTRADSGTLYLSGEIAGSPFNYAWGYNPRGKLATFPNGMIRIGSLCMDFLEHRVLLLDFVRNRVAILPEQTTIPPDMAAAATFLPMLLRQGHPYVPISIGGEMSYDYFYDTGSSLAALLASRSRWQRMTGRSGDEPDNQRQASTSWGRKIEVVGARLDTEFRIGPATISRPTIEFTTPDVLGGDSGLFGNVIFFDRYTVILDVAHYRFGILP